MYVRFDKRTFSAQTVLQDLLKSTSDLASKPISETDEAWIFEVESDTFLNAPGITCYKSAGEPTGLVYKAGQQSDDDPLEFVLSDESVDRMGDIIRVSGWKLKEFRQNPIALFGHVHTNIVGVWKNVRVEGKRLLGRLQFAKEGTSELVDTTRKLVEQKILKAVSVGFMPLKGEPRDPEAPWNGYEFTESALHEGSLVAVPANPNALAIAKALSPVAADQLFVRSDSVPTVVSTGENSGRVALMKTPNLDAVRKRSREMGINI